MNKYFSPSSFVAGVMLGLLIAGAWFFEKDLSLIPSSNSALTTNNENSVSESGAISVANQPAGSEVIVESITVPSPGIWVAVREMNGDNLGNVLGAARVGGPRTGISISLLRATEPDLYYAVELYRDDGGGTFDINVNSVYIDFDTSAPVIARFKTTE